MAKWNTNPAVSTLINAIKTQASACRALLTQIEQKADYWGDTDPDPSQVGEVAATVMGWMNNAKSWLTTEAAGTAQAGVTTLYEAREEIDHGGGGGTVGGKGGKGNKGGKGSKGGKGGKGGAGGKPQ